MPCSSGSGVLVNAGLQQVIHYAKWLSIVIGLGLIALGIALLAGYRLPLTTPRLDRGGRTRSIPSMFVFGISYAVASVGCTLPIFLGVVFGSITRNGFLSGMVSFLLYGAGHGPRADGAHRHARPGRRWPAQACCAGPCSGSTALAGVFLILAGAYLVYYWTFNLRFDETGSLTGGGLASWVEVQSAHGQHLDLRLGRGRSACCSASSSGWLSSPSSVTATSSADDRTATALGAGRTAGTCHDARRPGPRRQPADDVLA